MIMKKTILPALLVLALPELRQATRR